MVDKTKPSDEIHLKKYIDLLSMFISEEITVSEFETLFFKIRRDDTYWLSGQFSKNIGKILDTLFLDISDYTPEELFDSNDSINIDLIELRKRVIKALHELLHWQSSR